MPTIRRLNVRRSDAVGPKWVAGFAGVVLLVAFAAAAGSLPRPLVMPTLCFAALAIAAAVALIAWRRPMRRDAQHVTYWDIAGALAFLGMCAATLSEPDQLVSFWDGATRHR